MWFSQGSFESVSKLLQCCISLRRWVRWWCWDLGSCGCVDTFGQSCTGQSQQESYRGKYSWQKRCWRASFEQTAALSHWRVTKSTVSVHTVVGLIAHFWPQYHFSENVVGLAFVLCRLIKDLSCPSLSGCVLSRLPGELLWLHHLQKWNLYFSPLEGDLELLANNFPGDALMKPLLNDLSLNWSIWSLNALVVSEYQGSFLCSP